MAKYAYIHFTGYLNRKTLRAIYLAIKWALLIQVQFKTSARVHKKTFSICIIINIKLLTLYIPDTALHNADS
jgi:hypothetical protein